MVRVPEPRVKLEMPPGAELDPFLVVGWDQSLNHAGIVVLDHLGELDDYLYLATLARDAKRCRGATRIPSEITGQKDKAMRSARRLVWIGKWLDSVIGYLDEIAAGRLVYVSIEDYAYAAGHGAHQMGEVGGTLRGTLLTWPSRRFRLRLHDPASVKLFGVGKGNADQQQIRQAVLETWGTDFERYGRAKNGTGPADDLCDALILAVMAWTEVHLRAGRINLADLPVHQRKIFLRATKTNPINVLAREWITV